MTGVHFVSEEAFGSLLLSEHGFYWTRDVRQLVGCG